MARLSVKLRETKRRNTVEKFKAKRAALFDKYMGTLRTQSKVSVRKELLKN